MKKLALIICLLPLVGGCIKAIPRTDPVMFDTKPLASCLVVSVDLSGSFADDFGDRAYPLLLKIMDKFFTVSMGEDSKVVLSQMSGHDQVILFEGTPRELRRRFASPDELAEFMLEHSGRDRSPIYESAGQTFRYVNSMADVTEDSKVLTAIISDLKDSETISAKRSATGRKMLSELESYQAKGGALALYCVDLEETSRWKRILDMAGFKPGQFVISNDLVESPPMPVFE